MKLGDRIKDYVLTYKYQHSKKCADGKRINKLLYFLNGVLILEQKMPFDDSWDNGYQIRTVIFDEFLLDGRLYQKRKYSNSGAWWRASKHKEDGKIREVKYPISKKILEQFNIPKGTRIEVTELKEIE